MNKRPFVLIQHWQYLIIFLDEKKEGRRIGEREREERTREKRREEEIRREECLLHTCWSNPEGQLLSTFWLQTKIS